MNANDFDLELQELERLSTVKLLALDRLDPSAFISLKKYLCDKAERLQNEHVISKQILGVIRGATSAIRNHVEYVPSESEHLRLADEFEMLLDLMIRENDARIISRAFPEFYRSDVARPLNTPPH